MNVWAAKTKRNLSRRNRINVETLFVKMNHQILIMARWTEIPIDFQASSCSRIHSRRCRDLLTYTVSVKSFSNAEIGKFSCIEINWRIVVLYNIWSKLMKAHVILASFWFGFFSRLFIKYDDFVRNEWMKIDYIVHLAIEIKWNGVDANYKIRQIVTAFDSHR